MTLRTALTAMLGVKHPLLLAPMARVAGGRLAVAVSAAGGLGLVGGGYGEREWLLRELTLAGEGAVGETPAGGLPVGVGFITWALHKDPALLEVALEHGPRAILLSFGDVRPFAPRVKAAGVPLIAQVQGVEQARAALGEGADVLVAQGTEAGGHAGARATLPLVPAVVDLADAVPVLAAGGIADGRGLAAALMLGAAGVLCGTAFFASEEALSHPNAKRAAMQATGDDTERGSVFDVVRGLDWPRGWTIRTLRNRFSEQWGADLPGLLRNLEREQTRYARASEQGDTSVAAVVVGEAIGLVRATEPAAAIVQRIVADAERLLREAPGRFVT